ncbi:hypothetical protein MPSEU_000313400 [Mayamaea pseudoterrestris]|nr:hypothetical protein MPSEU_000313400 [Mayamaea pseudoterrestris]
MSPSSTATPTLDTLLLLDAYQSAQLQGNASLKASMWSLTKARREKPGIGASDVRLDLEPILRMKESLKEEPCLVQEQFSLINVTQKDPLEKENAAATPTIPSATSTAAIGDNENTTGLRNRHSKSDYSTKNDETKPSMTKEELLPVDDTPAASSIPDPLQLLGGALPPRDLFAAQAQAKQALESYIQAANLIQQMQMLMISAKK